MRRNQWQQLVELHLPSPLLDCAAALLLVDPFGLGGAAGLGGLALHRADVGAGDEVGEALAGFLAVGFLGAVAAGGDDDLALVVSFDPASCFRRW
jgi:hypothetical protein